MAPESNRRRLFVVRSEEPSVVEVDRAPSVVLRLQEELRAIPSWTDVALVLAVCVPFWAGLTWLVSAWL